MTQYLLSVHHSGEIDLPADVIEQVLRDVDAFNKELANAGADVFAGGLMPPHAATVVRVEDGETVLTDGPFLETKEHLGGFWVVRAAHLDEALAWAAKATAACRQPVEVRPFQPDQED